MRVSLANVSEGQQEAARPSGGLWGNLALYTLARIVIIAVVTAVLTLIGVPLLVSLPVAIIVAFPISVFAFRGLRNRTTAALAARTANRDAERERLRAELRGGQ